MKFTVTMKSPDSVQDALDDAAREMTNAIQGVDADEWDSLYESKRDKLGDICSKWFEYMEYLTVEVDTEAGTCTVVGSGSV